ncbi:MAG: exosortase H [Thermoanaerobaculia bacterium]|nr:exosortase H [Thermoanaerobaculia bacterium]
MGDNRQDNPRDDPPLPRRPEVRFLALFLILLLGSFTLLSLRPVNDRVIEPFTASIARVSGVALEVVGEQITREGTVLRSPEFAVNIENGCNGVEAMVIFLAAVLAFPAPWSARLAGLGLGIVVIQAVNLVRVVALFLTGAYFPALFDSSHTVIWQGIVILVAVLLWIYWARRFLKNQPSEAA